MTARVLAVLGSARKTGFTASLFDEAVAGALAEGADIERVELARFEIGPCTGCFSCIRAPGEGCVLDDPMGRRGEGELWRKLGGANALLIADAVYCWGISARAHTFFERLYPFLWTGTLSGMPFGSVSCASNQGMQHLARGNFVKWAYTFGMRLAGSVAAHVAAMERARGEARELGRRLARGAAEDAGGRKRLEEPERALSYVNSPWSVVRPYLENLSRGAMSWEGSLLEEAEKEGVFEGEALKSFRAACGEFGRALALHRTGGERDAAEAVTRAAAFWAEATWKQFLERDVIGVRKPDAYRSPPKKA